MSQFKTHNEIGRTVIVVKKFYLYGISKVNNNSQKKFHFDLLKLNKKITVISYFLKAEFSLEVFRSLPVHVAIGRCKIIHKKISFLSLKLKQTITNFFKSVSWFFAKYM